MLKNYFLIALRNLWRNRSFSIINIAGLSVSMCVCLLTISMIVESYTSDEFHENKDRIVRITHQQKDFFNHISLFATAPVPLGRYFRDYVSGVEDVAVLKRFGTDITVGDRTFFATGLYTDPSFFHVFSFDEGDVNLTNALSLPYSVVLSQTLAEKFFGDSNPVSKTISLYEIGECTVTGVIPDPPTNSHIRFEVLLSSSTLQTMHEATNPLDDWHTMTDSYVYVLMREPSESSSFNEVLSSITDQHYPEAREKALQFQAQPFTEIAPARQYIKNEMTKIQTAEVGFFLFAVTLVIMLSAGFNYTNLSIARSLTRTREVGIRKVSGARKRQVFVQFIVEAVVLSLGALLLAIALLPNLKDAYLALLGPMNQITFSDSYLTYLLFLFFAVLVGICAGFVPASLMARLDPVKVLNDLSGIKLLSGLGLRNALILFQFVISILFIITSSVLFRQYQYGMSEKLGFDKENIVNIELKGNDYEKVANIFSQHKDVSLVSASSGMPATHQVSVSTLKNEATGDSIHVTYFSVSDMFIKNLKIKILAGSDFSLNQSSTNEQFVVLNERAVEWLGYSSSESVLGNLVTIGGEELQVIGVVQNFHYRPIDTRDPIGPFAFRYKPSEFRYINLRLQSNQLGNTMAELESLWKKIDTEQAFTSYLFADQMKNVLNGYRIMSGLTRFISVLAIGLACMGLLGLTIYIAQTRKREIAIRKIHGASVFNLISLLSKGFFINLLAASCIALPLGYFLNKLWLDNVVYKMELKLSFMIADVALLIGFGLLIVMSQTYNVSIKNPTESLHR